MEFWLSIDPQTRANRNLYKKYIAQKHNLPVRHPNYPKFRKANQAYNPFAEPQYGRFIGNQSIVSSLLTKVDDILDLNTLPFKLLRPDKRVVMENNVGLVAATYLQNILKRNNSELVKE